MKIERSSIKQTSLTWLALFTTTGTLLCCTLPIILIALGMGSTMAALVTNVPLIVTLSEHKVVVFVISGLLLIASAWVMYRPGRHCPTDPQLGQLCHRVERWNRRVYWLSVLLWLIGFYSAFLALPIKIWLEHS